MGTPRYRIDRRKSVMTIRYTVPEPGDYFIRVEDVEQAIEDYEATEENEHGEFEVPFVYIALKDLWTGGDAGNWHGLEDGNYEEMILESYFVEYITDLINQCYEMPGEKQQSSWPYSHMKMDYEAAAEEAKQDYTEVTFGGYTYYVR